MTHISLRNGHSCAFCNPLRARPSWLYEQIVGIEVVGPLGLLARRADRLAALVDRLAGDGIPAEEFLADLNTPGEAAAAIASIRDRLGRIDVVEYGPISGEQGFIPAARLDSAELQALIPLLLLSPVEIMQAVLPEWRGRGDGAFLLTQGASAVQGIPHLSGVGPVMAAARNYVYSLYGELAAQGIYAGTLSVAGLITGSEIAEATVGAVPDSGAAFPSVNPDDLAQAYWELYTRRDRAERIYPEPMRKPRPTDPGR